MSVLELTDGQIHYDLAGTGSPPLLLIHAGIADRRMWDGLFEGFAEDHRVLRHDLRGFGQTALPNGPFAHHEDARALLEALEMAPAWILGVSFGGRIAIDLCLAHPELVRGLILVSPAVSGFQAGEALRRFGEQEDALYEAGKIDEAVELNMRTWVDGPQRGPDAVDPELRARLARMQHHAFVVPEPEQVASIPLDPPAIGRLGSIDRPALVLSGALDVPDFVTLSETVASGIPGAERVVFPDAAHMLCLEEPDRFARLVTDFIARHERPASSDA